MILLHGNHAIKLLNILEENKMASSLSYFNTMKFRLYFIFIVIISFQIFTIGIFAFRIVDKGVGSITVESAKNMLKQVPRHMNTIFGKIDNDTIMFLANPKLREALASSKELSVTRQMQKNENIYYALSAFGYSDEVDSVFVQDINGDTYSYYNNYSFTEDQNRMFVSLLASIELSGGEIKWIGTGIPGNDLIRPRHMITGIREIYDADSYDLIGHLIVNIDESYIYEIYDGIKIGTTGIIYLATSDGTIISHSDKTVIGNHIDKKLLSKFTDKEGSITYKNSNGQEILLIYNISPTNGFITIGEVLQNELMQPAYTIGNIILLIGVVTITVALIMAYIFLSAITKPLKELGFRMKKVEEGDFNTHITISGTEEIKMLNDGYNNMIEKIKELIEQIHIEEKEKKEAEFHALQAQINPHFICNTLNSVKWMAHFHHMDNITEMVTALIKLIYNSVGKGDTYITIRDELENLESYLKIQKYRYNDKFEVYYKYNDDVLDCIILKFIMQPLLENAIFHGMEGIEKGKIYINIDKIKDKVGEILKIEIIDNGVGMDKETIEVIMNSSTLKSHSRSYSSIGIKNVDERIKLHFGHEYGISICSEKMKGTNITVLLPSLWKEVDNNEIS
jgi:two-component system sensor histidine kinase YesM